MYKEIKGNLLDFPDGINIICHQCNCQNCFGAGIALQIKKRYPQAYKADSEHFQNAWAGNTHQYEVSENMMGTISHAKIDENQFVINLYAQNLGTGRNRETNYDAFANGLERILDFVRIVWRAETTIDDPPIIGFPRLIGCGLGGGNWKIIKAMLEVFHEESGCDVTIVNFNK